MCVYIIYKGKVLAKLVDCCLEGSNRVDLDVAADAHVVGLGERVAVSERGEMLTVDGHLELVLLD